MFHPTSGSKIQLPDYQDRAKCTSYILTAYLFCEHPIKAHCAKVPYPMFGPPVIRLYKEISGGLLPMTSLNIYTRTRYTEIQLCA